MIPDMKEKSIQKEGICRPCGAASGASEMEFGKWRMEKMKTKTSPRNRGVQECRDKVYCRSITPKVFPPPRIRWHHGHRGRTGKGQLKNGGGSTDSSDHGLAAPPPWETTGRRIRLKGGRSDPSKKRKTDPWNTTPMAHGGMAVVTL